MRLGLAQESLEAHLFPSGAGRGEIDPRLGSAIERSHCAEAVYPPADTHGHASWVAGT